MHAQQPCVCLSDIEKVYEDHSERALFKPGIYTLSPPHPQSLSPTTLEPTIVLIMSPTT
jgi:hypothetical protein